MMETNKYIIELEEMIASTANGQMPLYRIKGFNAPVFDSVGVNKLMPYKEPDIDVIRKEAYEEGHKDGMQLSIDDAKLKEEYRQGLNDAWETAKKISIMDSPTRDKIFGLVITSNIIDENSAPEAIEKIRQYEQKWEEQIQVGDEVDGKSGRGTITKISDAGVYFNIMWKNGLTGCYRMENFKKTGRHFPEIVEVLRKMQEVRE